MNRGICKWVVRPGTHNTYWAFTPCKKGFSPLTRINKVDEIEKAYNGRLCPICGNKIVCNMYLVEEQEDGVEQREAPL